MSNPTNADSGEPDDIGRGDDAAQGQPEEVHHEAPGTDGDEAADDSAVAARSDQPKRSAREGSEQRSVRAAEAGKGRKTASRAEAQAARRKQPSIFKRIGRFIRQVIAELRKVVTPTRSELATYTAVVIAFLIVMMAYVGVLDFGFGRLVLWAFGG